MLRLLTAAFGLILATVAPLAGAHHGFAAHFDPDQLIRIEGTVKQFDFINPHSFLLIDSVNHRSKSCHAIGFILLPPRLHRLPCGKMFWTTSSRFERKGSRHGRLRATSDRVLSQYTLIR